MAASTRTGLYRSGCELHMLTLAICRTYRNSLTLYTLTYITDAPQEQPDLSGLPEGIDPEDL